jgi:hypothetical protein
MAKIIPISEHFQHFLAEMKESFWGDLYGQTPVFSSREMQRASESRERSSARNGLGFGGQGSGGKLGFQLRRARKGQAA